MSEVGYRSGAVVVAYFPPDDFAARLAAIAASVDQLIVVDNTPQGSEIAVAATAAFDHVLLISPMQNLGVAAALNAGVNELERLGADYFFLFDQDSAMPADMVGHQLECSVNLGRKSNVAQIGPTYFDSRLAQQAPFIRFEGWRMRRIPALGKEAIKADYLITSGTCISKSAWRAIGAMDDTLFIDFVDIEWGLRAKYLGWQSFGNPQIIMQHTLGEQPVRVLGKSYPLHSPIRHYYYFRNCVALMKRSYIPSGWKWVELYKLIPRFAVYALFTDQRREHAFMMLKGLWHGLLGRSGIYR